MIRVALLSFWHVHARDYVQQARANPATTITAVVVLRSPQGAVGIVEASFVTPFSPFTIEVHGTQGSLLYGTPDGLLRIRGSVAGTPGSSRWGVWTDIPPDLPTPFSQWVTHIQQGTRVRENIQAAIDLSRLVEAANRSATLNQPVVLDP